MCTHLVGLALISLFTDLFCVIMTNKTLILSNCVRTPVHKIFLHWDVYVCGTINVHT